MTDGTIHSLSLSTNMSTKQLAFAAALGCIVAMLPTHTLLAQVPVTIRDRAAAEAARKPDQLGVIDGVVTDSTLRPLGAADVSVVGTGARVVTSANGRFRILRVPPGQYLLVVRRVGYSPTSGIVAVPAEDTLRLAYTLSYSVSVLDTMHVRERRVSLRMLGFEQRRMEGVGQFITQEDLERRGSMAVTDVLRNVRGLDVSRITNEQFGGSVALSRREGGSFNGGASGACPMQVLLDGIVLPQNFNLELLPPPKQVSGIEVYTGPATIPPQFGGPDRRCGVIAVWTRDGY